MSVLDQFHTAEEEVAKRLRELKPLVDEYHQLAQVAQRLSLSLNKDATATSQEASASAESTPSRQRKSTTKARSGASTRDESDDGATATTAAASVQPRRARSPRGSTNKSRPGSKPTARREHDVLRLVNQRPGITISQIAKELGVDATGLYRPVHKLEQRGAISKHGRALQPNNRD